MGLTFSNVSEADLHAVVEKLPELGCNGFRYEKFRRGQTKEERQLSFEGDRDRLRRSFREFQLCCTWLSNCEKRQTIDSTRNGSYSLKHVVESWAALEGVDDNYVSNGAFIAAAVHMGFKTKPIDESPNAYFNISHKSAAVQEAIKLDRDMYS